MIITGGNGLLGSTFEFVENSKLHTRKDCDLTNKEETLSYFKENSDDTIIHLAARVGGVKDNMENNKEFFYQNKLINDNVISASLENNVKNLVTVLSTCVFPDKEIKYPLTVDQIDNGDPHNSNYGYSYSKRLLRYQTHIFRKMTGNNWFSIIPTNLYGYNDNYNLEKSHIIPALIHKAYLSKINDIDFEIWGDGSSLRQFVFADDMRDIILWSIDNWKSELPLMATNTKEYSIKDVVNIIADRFDIHHKVKYNKNMPSGQFRKTASSDVSNWDFIPLEDGINKTIDYFIKNYNSVRK